MRLPSGRRANVVRTRWFARLDSDVGNRQPTQTSPKYQRIQKEHAFQILSQLFAPSSRLSALIGRITWGARDRRTYFTTSNFPLHTRIQDGGIQYRGIRTRTFTYSFFLLLELPISFLPIRVYGSLVVSHMKFLKVLTNKKSSPNKLKSHNQMILDRPSYVKNHVRRGSLFTTPHGSYHVRVSARKDNDSPPACRPSPHQSSLLPSRTFALAGVSLLYAWAEGGSLRSRRLPLYHPCITTTPSPFPRRSLARSLVSLRSTTRARTHPCHANDSTRFAGASYRLWPYSVWPSSNSLTPCGPAATRPCRLTLPLKTRHSKSRRTTTKAPGTHATC